MKKLIFTIATLLSFYSISNAQVALNCRDIIPKNPWMILKEMEASDYEYIKNSMTIFVVPDKDENRIPEFEEMLSEVWNISPFHVVTKDKLYTYVGKEGYTYFVFKSGGYVIYSSNTSKSVQYFAYNFSNTLETNKNERKYARIYLSVPKEFGLGLDRDAKGLKKYDPTKYNSDGTKAQTNSDEIYNWDIGFLRGYLKEINDGITNKSIVALSDKYINESKAAALKTDTLYLSEDLYRYPKNVLGLRDVFHLKELEKVTKYYKYPVKFLPKATLSDMIMNNQDGILYGTIVYQLNKAYVAIYDSKSNQLLLKFQMKEEPNKINKILSKTSNMISKI